MVVRGQSVARGHIFSLAFSLALSWILFGACSDETDPATPDLGGGLVDASIGYDGTPPWVPEGDGPWAGALCSATSLDGITFKERGQFLTRAGVANLFYTSSKELIATYQYFSFEDQSLFNVIAYSISKDEGDTWSGPHKLVIEGLTGEVPVVDPTLVQLDSGDLRLYFTYHRPGDKQPSLASAKSSAIDVAFQYEEGPRVQIDGVAVLDPAVVLHEDIWHYFAPRHDGDETKSLHATSTDGLAFTLGDDLALEISMLGAAVSAEGGIRFYGQGKGGIGSVFSADGNSWLMDDGVRAVGVDPGVARLNDGHYLMVYGCPK